MACWNITWTQDSCGGSFHLGACSSEPATLYKGWTSTHAGWTSSKLTIFMGSSCTRGIAHNIREELWSYFALSGLLFLNIGIVMVVYALKRATTYPVVLEVFGLGLIIMGVVSTLASWYVHRQHRQKKPICTCASFCSKNAHGAASEDSRLTAQDKYRQNNLYISGNNASKVSKPKQTGNDPQHTIKMFSTPEFQVG